MSKHLILGTAGHIDHGKTALVKTLTGIDCDTHAEEKQRGITINLGFAHLDLSSGNSISIVDVPGHKDFIHTMVAGASGIDFVLLVISADSGIMPQTREHLQIMEMLNLSRGVIALTKIDLVDEDIIELAQEEIEEFTKGTFLETAPVIAVSAVTGEGIPQLSAAIEACAETVSQRPQGEIFRLFVDRIFTISGFGTVVTGSAIGGLLHTGDHVYLNPTGKKLRVRRLERHNSEVTSVVAGDRASLNLVGLHREDFKRGMIISDRILGATTLIDARLTLFSHARRISIWSDTLFLLGTFEAQVRIHLLDKNSASGGETVLVQIHLPEPCNVSVGDRFIIRSTSSDVTLGGGQVIDAVPLHHRRRPPDLIRNLENIAEGELPELITAEVNKARRVLTHNDVAQRLNVSSAEVMAVITNDLPDDIVAYPGDETAYLITGRNNERFLDTIQKNISAFHKRNPLEEGGRTVKDLLGVLGIDKAHGGDNFLRIMLEKQVLEKKLKQVNTTWVSVSHSVKLSEDMLKKIDLVDTFLKGFGLKVPLTSEIESFSKREGIDPKILNQVLKYLINKKRIHRIDGDYLHSEIVNQVRIKMLKTLAEKPQGLTVAQFRDLISDNRKICLRLFLLFDMEGITERKGDVRVITQKGRDLIERP